MSRFIHQQFFVFITATGTQTAGRVGEQRTISPKNRTNICPGLLFNMKPRNTTLPLTGGCGNDSSCSRIQYSFNMYFILHIKEAHTGKRDVHFLTFIIKLYTS